MRIYRVVFHEAMEEYSPKSFWAAPTKEDKTNRLALGPDKSCILLERDLRKYSSWGGCGSNSFSQNTFIPGYARFEYLGNLDDALFKPTLSEAEFVEETIKNRQSGEVIGYQG